jgi:hypothetical protein
VLHIVSEVAVTIEDDNWTAKTIETVEEKLLEWAKDERSD